METFSALLAICAGNSPVPGEFPAQRPVTRSFDVFFDLRLNKPLSKQSWGWWLETLKRPLWRHRNVNGSVPDLAKSWKPRDMDLYRPYFIFIPCFESPNVPVTWGFLRLNETARYDVVFLGENKPMKLCSTVWYSKYIEYIKETTKWGHRWNLEIARYKHIFPHGQTSWCVCVCVCVCCDICLIIGLCQYDNNSREICKHLCYIMDLCWIR